MGTPRQREREKHGLWPDVDTLRHEKQKETEEVKQLRQERENVLPYLSASHHIV